MKLKIRLFALLLAILAALTACQKPEDPPVNPPEESRTTENTEKNAKESETEEKVLTDAELETLDDGEDGYFYDGFEKTGEKWKVSTASGTKLIKEGYLQLTISSTDSESMFTRPFVPAADFELEMRMCVVRFGRSLTMRVDQGTTRLFVSFNYSNLTIASNGTSVLVPLDVKNDYHTYRFLVSDGIGYVYVDGEFKTMWALQTGNYTTKEIQIFGKGTDTFNERARIDYITYRPNPSPIALKGVTNGQTFTDVDSLTLKTLFKTTAAYTSDQIGYYANGVLLGETDFASPNYEWKNIPAGTYSVWAACSGYTTPTVTLHFVKSAQSAEKPTAKGTVSTASHLESSYVLHYTAGAGSGNIHASDGFHDLQISHSASNSVVSTFRGNVTLDGALPGAYTVTVDGNAAQLYREGVLLYSFLLPISAQSVIPTATGSISGLSTEAWNETFYSFPTLPAEQPLDSFGYSYAAEFDYETGSEATLRLFDGVYLTDLRFGAQGGAALNAPLGKIENYTLNPLPQGKHRYRLTVSNGIAVLDSEGKWYGSIRLPQNAETPRLFASGSGISDLTIRSTLDRYYTNVPFDSDVWKKYFTLPNGMSGNAENNEWTLTASSGARGTATLKVYAKNATIESKVNFDRKTNGQYFLAARYTNDTYGLFAGYDFDAGKWIIQTSASGKEAIVASNPASKPSGEVTLRLVLNENEVTLYADGTEVAKGTQTAVVSFGNVGIATDGAGVGVRSFSYSGEGKPLLSTVTVSIPGGGSPDFIEYAEDSILVIASSSSILLSAGNMKTYIKYPGSGKDLSKYSNNMLILSSGNYLSIIRQKSNDGFVDYAYRSTNAGASWSSGVAIEKEANNRITMNCKVMQTSGGRVFFVSGESGDGMEFAGQLAVWYSDDEGKSWKGSETEFSYDAQGVNAQEGCIAELKNGVLRFFCRTDCGFLYYVDSFDNGVTWQGELKPTRFASVLSAFNVEKDPGNGDLYIAWEYNNKNDNGKIQSPRTRIALARSRDDGETWEYLGDVDELSTNVATTRHYNIGLFVSKNYVYVSVIKVIPNGAANENYKHIVTLKKDDLVPLVRFSELHSYVNPESFGNVSADLTNHLLILAENGDLFLAGEYGRIENAKGMETYLPIEALAKLIGAGTETVQDGMDLSLGTVRYSFRKGADSVTYGSKTANLTDTIDTTDGKPAMSLRDFASLFGFCSVSEKGYSAICLSKGELSVDYLLGQTYWVQ